MKPEAEARAAGAAAAGGDEAALQACNNPQALEQTRFYRAPLTHLHGFQTRTKSTLKTRACCGQTGLKGNI